MLTEKQLIAIGERCKERLEEDFEVRIEDVKPGARDAVVRVGKRKIIAVSEVNGEVKACLGKEATFISPGEWDIITCEGTHMKGLKFQ